MIYADVGDYPNSAVLAIVKDGHGAYESVTVFRPYYQSESSTLYNSFFGKVDITYSWRNTYKMLDRKKSGFWTGKPLKSETFIFTTRNLALAQAKALYDKKKKIRLGKNEPNIRRIGA